MELINILKEINTKLIDVREAMEFQAGSVQGAVNIPLSVFAENFDIIRNMNGPKVLFCRSGMRSRQAQMFLQTNGIDEVYNGGGLFEMESLISTSN